jgi:hypothetical protein
LSTLCGELNAKQLCLRDDVLMELSKASDLGAFLKIFIISMNGESLAFTGVSSETTLQE